MVTTTPLRKLRLKYQISLDELAAAAGFSNQYLSALERGKSPISSEQQSKIAEAFILLADSRSNAMCELSRELTITKDSLFTPMEAEDEL